MLSFMLPDSPRGLLATDLDGTLAVSGVIGDAERAAAAELRSAGIPVLVITGRNRRSLLRVDGLWDVADEVLFSSGAGLLEESDAAGTERARLNAGELGRILTILDAAGEDYCILDPVPGNHHFTWKTHRPPVENPDFGARMEIYRPWAKPMPASPGDASQVLVIRPPGEVPDAELLNALSEWSVFYSSSPLDHQSLWLEIFPEGLNKGTVLARRCAEKAIPKERVLVLGNDHNDTPMLEWARHGRVVAGAPEQLKSAYQVLPPAGKGGFTAGASEALGLFCQRRSEV